MDNLSSHLSAAVGRAIASVGGARVLYLPSYSPDFNPIENLWSKVKEALRSAAQRTVETVGQAVERAFAAVTAVTAVTAQDCRGFFANCGYAI